MNNLEENVDLSEWNRWFNKFVAPVFRPEGREEYYKKLKEIQAPFYPRHSVAEKFYDTIKRDLRFDDQLKMFFSFLYSCGFFMENIIVFEDWLRMTNWSIPHSKDHDEKTIAKTLEEPNGMNLLKSKLRWLPFLNRPDGS
jgi:hypothetical protein